MVRRERAGHTRTLVRAALVVDGAGVDFRPGALLVEDGRLRAVGAPEDVGVPADARVIDLPDRVLTPGLVNAHAHLDLTHIGPVAGPLSLIEFIEIVRSRRATDDAGVAASVARGVALARAGGTALIGDIAGVGSRVPIEVLRSHGLAGVSYVEVFGSGRRQAGAIAHLERAVAEIPPDAGGVRLGLQPHAPYSCGLDVYLAAARLERPVATHLAESPEEIAFVARGEGPIAAFLERLGLLDEDIVPAGCHPIEAIAAALRLRPFALAHVNDVEPAHFELLRATGATVVYCPRASAWFGYPRKAGGGTRGHAHRYREMLDAGVNVALGTDSMICLDTPDRLSVLDEMRLLFRRDGTDPRTLLAMATVNGARALGFPEALVAFRPGSATPFLSHPIDASAGGDPLGHVLGRSDAPEWLGPDA